MHPLDRYKHVEGQVRWTEARKLYELAKRIPPIYTVVVEIGSYRGRSTLALAQGLKDGYGGNVIAIDPHYNADGYCKQDADIMDANIGESGLQNIQQIRALSQHVAGEVPTYIDMLWIDGDHSPEGVMRDFELYAPRIKQGGIIALHDTQYRGPWTVVHDRILEGKEFGQVHSWWSMIYAVKNGRGTTVQNKLAVLACHHALATAARIEHWFTGDEIDGKTI